MRQKTAMKHQGDQDVIFRDSFHRICIIRFCDIMMSVDMRDDERVSDDSVEIRYTLLMVYRRDKRMGDIF